MTPPTPFLLTRWARFTPTFQTENDDANIGASGIRAGAWYIVGHTLTMHIFFSLAGAGASVGTGNLLIPFPPGYSSADVDVASMPRLQDEEGTIEGQIGVLVNATISASKSVRETVATLATTDGVIVSSVFELDGLDTLVSGDSLVIRLDLPLKEPALP